MRVLGADVSQSLGLLLKLFIFHGYNTGNGKTNSRPYFFLREGEKRSYILISSIPEIHRKECSYRMYDLHHKKTHTIN